MRPADRTFDVRIPHAHRYVALRGHANAPLDSALDPGQKGIRLTLAGRAGPRATGLFSGDAFLVKQPSGRRAAGELAMTGGHFSACRTATKAAARASRRRRVVRRFFGRSRHARFTTRGRYSSATVRGTTWVVEDRCDGTLTKALRGTVVVTDRKGHRVVLHAGQQYLALARRGNR